MRKLISWRYVVLALLYMGRSTPSFFFLMTLPVIMRMEGFSLEIIGYLQLATLPYLFKFIWAPLVDKKGNSHNHYKHWTLVTGLFYGCLILFLSSLDLHSHLQIIVLIILLISAIDATQDIAISALYIKILDFDERGTGSTAKVVGLNVATILGSGLLLLVYNHSSWQMTILVLAMLVFLPLLLLPLVKENCRFQKDAAPPVFHWKAIVDFFRVKGMWQWLFLVVCNSISISAVYFILKPFLVNYGMHKDTIAFLVGFYGMGIGVLTAMASGFSRFQRFLLKRRQAYIISIVLGLISVGLFVPISAFPKMQGALYIAIALINVAITLSTIINATLFMDFSRRGNEGLDYSLQMTGIHIGGMAMIAVSGVIVSYIGYSLFFLMQAGLAVIMLLAAVFLFNDNLLDKLSRSM